MRGKAHLVCGIIAGAGISIATRQPIINSVLITGFSALFSLIPDIDHPQSTLGHYIKPVSKFIKEKIGHRTVTHSGLWMILFGFLLYRFFNTVYFPAVLGGFVGWLSHMISDSMTTGGVPWFWPLKRKRYGFTRIKSGDKDWLLVIFTDILMIGIGYAAANYQMFIK